MTVVTEVTPSGAPVAAKVPNARSTKAPNASTHTASAEPAAKGGTVRAAAMVAPSTAAATVTAAVAATVTATVAASNGGIEWNSDSQGRHGYQRNQSFTIHGVFSRMHLRIHIPVSPFSYYNT